MALYAVKPAFRRCLESLIPFLRPVHPDVLTWGALVCSVVGGILFSFAVARRWLFLVIPVLLFLRIALNALDGLLAQATGKARPAGEVLNEATDRLSDAALILGVAYSPLSSPAWGLPALAAVLFSSYAGVLGKVVGVGRQYGGILDKADRMLWLGAACVAAFFLGDVILFRLPDSNGVRLFDGLLGLFALLGAATALQRLLKIRALLSALRAR